MKEYHEVCESILKRRNLSLSQAELEILKAAPENYLPAQRLLGMQAFNEGDYAEAVWRTGIVWRVAPNGESASNHVSALYRARRYADAIALAEHPKTPLEPTLRAAFLSELHGALGHHAENKQWGRRALVLKEREARILARPPEIKLSQFNPETPERNIISFSLYGKGLRYLEGAVRNAIVIRHLYPGWTARFYVDASVPIATKQTLQGEGAEIKEVPKLPAAKYGLFWRFLVEDDRDVDLYLVRDVDSVPTLREAVAVRDWLASGKPFHVMRDYRTHSALILAGLWGAHRGNVPQMGQRILNFVRARDGILNSRVTDQLFLRREVWPFMRDRAFVQDSVFNFKASAPFDPRFPLPQNMHVRQDDFAARMALRVAKSKELTQTRAVRPTSSKEFPLS